MTHQSIKCGDLAEFMQCVAACVREGLTFEAHAPTLTIQLTGGY